MISLCAYIPPSELFSTEIGEPIISHYPVDNNFGILQIVSTDDRVYILQESRCVVSAYTTNGDYLYTIYAYTHSNGRAEIAVNRDVTQINNALGVEQGIDAELPDNRLYLKDKYENIYVFEDDVFVEFIPKGQENLEVYGLDFEEQSKEFILKGASVYKCDENGNCELVISRPFWLFFAQAKVSDLSILVLILMAVLLVIIGKKAANHKNVSQIKDDGKG